jgi:hypothetical protein
MEQTMAANHKAQYRREAMVPPELARRRVLGEGELPKPDVFAASLQQNLSRGGNRVENQLPRHA